MNKALSCLVKVKTKAFLLGIIGCDVSSGFDPVVSSFGSFVDDSDGFDVVDSDGFDVVECWGNVTGTLI